MNLSQVKFEAAFGESQQLYKSDLPEFCFSGRSNVGKSSLINKLLGRKAIAKVSSTPGKTVTVNFYTAGDCRFVDLPGYGYAKITDAEKLRFSSLCEHYFCSGRNIKMCFQLVDMRRLATDDDKDMLFFLRTNNIPYTVVLTKCDKLNKTETEKMLSLIKEDLGELINGIEIVPFSSLKGNGVQRLREIIEKTF